MILKDSLVCVILTSCLAAVFGFDDLEVKTTNAVVRVKPATHVRVKRAASGLTQAEKDDILAKHNEHRKAEPASNMQYMRWDDDLASMAQIWASRCNWAHGQPDNTSPFNPVGQNLWASSGRASNPAVAVAAWHDEIRYYDYDSNTCEPNKACGHYTQIVWDETTHVGCGIHTCTPGDGGDKTQGDYIVCNYGPAGNYPRKPYAKGDTCTGCKSGKFWCKDGMCDDCKGTAGCTCEAECFNCATVNNNECSCSCTSGWRGNTCQDVCRDTHANCGASPGWPAFWCNSGRSYVDNNCFALCGYCEINPNPMTCENDNDNNTGNDNNDNNNDNNDDGNNDNDDDNGATLRIPSLVLVTLCIIGRWML